MKNINKILTVSMIAMLAVPAAHAKIVSESMLGTTGHYGTGAGQVTVQSEINAKQDTLVTDGANKNIQGAGGITVSKSGDVITITGTTYDDTSLAGRVTTAEGEIDALQGTVGDNTSGLVKDVADLQSTVGGLGDLATKDKVSTSDLDSTLASTISGKLDANTAITAGTHTKITYDANGLVTSGADLQASDIPTLTLSKISDAGTAAAKDVDTSMTASSTSTDVPTTAAVASFVSGYAAAGAEVNVQADWNQTTTTADDYIKNKPTLGALAAKDSVAKTDLATALANEIDGKADAATSLAGYGITDAYTKTEADGKFQEQALVTAMSASSDDTHYPSAKAVYDAVEAAKTAATPGAASASTAGVARLYTSTGQNTDGSMTQKAVTDALDGKQATISDLSDIRTGAGKGATAVQPGDIAQTYSGTSSAAMSGVAVKQAIDGAAGNYAAASHTHNTSEVTALTSYAKGSSAEPLAAGDTLNAALGKLENQIDAKQDALGYTAENHANMVTSTSTYNTYLTNADAYPNMPVVNQMIANNNITTNAAIAKKIDTTVAADANTVMVRDSGGNYVKGLGNAVSVANDGTITVNEATKATQDGSGNTITTTYATKDEVTAVSNTIGGLDVTTHTGDGNVVTSVTQDNGAISVAMGMTAIPEPSLPADTAGTLVLTATPNQAGTGFVYHWEDLGR